MAALPAQGVLRVINGGQLTAALQAQDEEQAAAKAAAKLPDAAVTQLAGHIRNKFDQFKRHRNTNAGWSHRLLAALRTFNGQYSAEQLAAISKFGGSVTYARLVAMKCRGASSLLRDIYLGSDRPWGLAPPSDPDIPPDIMEKIHVLVQSEIANLASVGQQVDGSMQHDRIQMLMDAARDAAKKNARKAARAAEDKLDEILSEGGFYTALAEFLVDAPLFPFAVIKGPTVRMVPSIDYSTGQPVAQTKPKLFWERVSPFDIWWTPGVSDVANADFIERQRVTRAALNDALDLPGYNQKEVQAVLDEYGRGGLVEDWDSTDSERAVEESRENPILNQSGLITCLEWHGNIQGLMLLEYGMPPKLIEDPLRDYFVQAWLIGQHIIKAQLSPSPRKRAPYFITSFEKVPGTPVGNGLPDILADIQDVANASLRTLVNNMGMASGPQVIINTERLADGENPEDMFPWKRWYYKGDPMGNNGQVPVSFFQPNSNAQELMQVYQQFSLLADELSGIPRYLQGSGAGGGAGRTASGLAMLMGNANKILQTVAANIDRDIMEPLLQALYDMVMLTDTSGMLKGDEEIRVMGVNVAAQRETQRQRQLEFLQITANPLDSQIMGPKGRAIVLGAVAQNIGLDGEKVVPTEVDIEQQQQAMQTAGAAAQQQQMMQAGAQAQGAQQSPDATQDMGPRTRIAGGVG